MLQGGALGKSLTPRTAEMRAKKMIYAHMTQPGPSRKKLEPAEDGRDDGWIDQLSFGTNLQQKQAFQIWQLFRETMLEADHAATVRDLTSDIYQLLVLSGTLLVLSGTLFDGLLVLAAPLWQQRSLARTCGDALDGR